MSALSKPARISLLLAAAVLAPLLLTAIDVLIMRGRAHSPHLLHQASLVVIVASCIPFIALMPIGRVTRVVAAAICIVAWSFLVSDGGFWLCVQFGWPP